MVLDVLVLSLVFEIWLVPAEHAFQRPELLCRRPFSLVHDLLVAVVGHIIGGQFSGAFRRIRALNRWPLTARCFFTEIERLVGQDAPCLGGMGCNCIHQGRRKAIMRL